MQSEQLEGVFGLSAEQSRKIAPFALFAMTFIWGATFVWMKQILDATGPEIEEFGVGTVTMFYIGARFLIAALLLAVLFKSCRQGLADSQIWKFGAWLGLLLFLGFLSQMSALEEINPGTSAFLTSLYVVLTALFTTFFEAKKPAKIMWVGVGLATFGASFISGPPHLSWGRAELVTVICAFVFALHIVYTQRATKIADPMGISITSFIVVVGLSGLLLAFREGNEFVDLFVLLSVEGVLFPLICLGVLGSGVALVTLNLFQRYFDPVKAAILYSFEPVWATIIGLVLAMVPWSWWILVGGGAILLGNIIVEITTSEEETIAEKSEE